MERVADFPLFPLGIVALPTELVPLHIFEDRYKAMVEHCLETDSEFGVVYVGEDGLADVGCACEIEEVLERMPDGRINLIARGTRPFRIERRQEEFAYPAGVVEFLEDAAPDPDAEDPDDAEAAHEAYLELVRQATDRDPEPEEIAEMTAYEMAATVEFGPDVKQNLLDLRSEPERLRQVARLFRAALRRLDYVERAEVRAKSNGKVVFPS
jgi:Lon protease-like protein